jgi:hypothetical protein
VQATRSISGQLGDMRHDRFAVLKPNDGHSPRRRQCSVLANYPTFMSCLGCADLHRRDRDAAWPAVAAQLRDTVGVADRATLLATAALALSQVNRVIGAVRGSESEPPTSLNATLEFDVHAGSIVVRQWPKHPLCSC